MVRYKGAPPYARFVEFGEEPYPGQPADIPIQIGPHTLFIDRLMPFTSRWKPAVRSIAVIEAEIRRATVPGLRREDV